MEIFVVGGAIRDIILGREPKDLDFVVVGATPQDLLDRGFTQVGADFPVFLDSDGREFALARTERKVGNGHTGFETDFTPNISLEDDLVRRDLTINALAVKAEDWEQFWKTRDKSLVIDHVGGLQDIKHRVLRHVSEAFSEDPLRVLRVARFAARMGFDIAPETISLMRDMVDRGELDHLTKERVWAEIDKAMSCSFPNEFFDTLRQVGALKIVAGNATSVFENTGDILPQVIMGNGTPIHLWMALFITSTLEEVENFISWHKIPTEVADAIRFSQWFFAGVLSGVDGIMSACNRFRLWGNDTLLIQLAFVVRVLAVWPSHRFDELVMAIKTAAQINFASLSEEEQKGLLGPDIGAAITSKRREVIAKFLKRA